MTEVIFAHYRVTWNTEEDTPKAEYWIPVTKEESQDEDMIKKAAKVYVGSLLNLVELDADNDLHRYVLELLDVRSYRMVG